MPVFYLFCACCRGASPPLPDLSTPYFHYPADRPHTANMRSCRATTRTTNGKRGDRLQVVCARDRVRDLNRHHSLNHTTAIHDAGTRDRDPPCVLCSELTSDSPRSSPHLGLAVGTRLCALGQSRDHLRLIRTKIDGASPRSSSLLQRKRPTPPPASDRAGSASAPGLSSSFRSDAMALEQAGGRKPMHHPALASKRQHGACLEAVIFGHGQPGNLEAEPTRGQLPPAASESSRGTPKNL